ncbi:MAG TPA: hypothetical protein VK843_10630 [Planctomycetota bacterium]|nr:hypothetical protein [Planctomycetota bacterium]
MRSVDARDKSLPNDVAGEATNLYFDAQRRSAVFPVADTARCLILFGGESEPLRVPIEPQVGKLNVIRP